MLLLASIVHSHNYLLAVTLAVVYYKTGFAFINKLSYAWASICIEVLVPTAESLHLEPTLQKQLMQTLPLLSPRGAAIWMEQAFCWETEWTLLSLCLHLNLTNQPKQEEKKKYLLGSIQMETPPLPADKYWHILISCVQIKGKGFSFHLSGFVCASLHPDLTQVGFFPSASFPFTKSAAFPFIPYSTEVTETWRRALVPGNFTFSYRN